MEFLCGRWNEHRGECARDAFGLGGPVRGQGGRRLQPVAAVLEDGHHLERPGLLECSLSPEGVDDLVGADGEPGGASQLLPARQDGLVREESMCVFVPGAVETEHSIDAAERWRVGVGEPPHPRDVTGFGRAWS